MPTLATAGGGGAAAPGAGLAWGAGGGGGGWGIGGGLNFAGMGAAANMDFSGNPAALSASYANAYNAALGLNSQNYQNILAGYQQTAGNLNAATQQIVGGYNDLQTGVLNDLSNAGATQRQAINDTYAKEQGAAMQQLINRGLGNTTIQQGVQRGLIYDREKANVSLAEQIANLKASYRSNLGLAGLNYQNQAALQNAAQANQQLQWMNSVQAPYPDAAAYSRLAEMWGAAQEAEKNRALMSQLQSGMGGGGQFGGGYSGIRGSAFGPSWGRVVNPLAGDSFAVPPNFGGGGWLGGGIGGGYSDPVNVSPLAWGGGGDWGGEDYSDPTGQWAGGPVGGEDYSIFTDEWGY